MSTQHQEPPLCNNRKGNFTARNIVFGFLEGLTVPFALTAGLSIANTASSSFLTSAITDVATAAIYVCLGGYLAAKSEADHYSRNLKRLQVEIDTIIDPEADEVPEILAGFGIEPHEFKPVVDALKKNRQAWLDFVMRLQFGPEKPNSKRALSGAITFGVSCTLGGLVPLIPYIFIPIARNAVIASAVVTLLAVLVFGFAKGRYTKVNPFISALQTALTGVIAAAAAFGLGKAVHG